MFVQIYCDGSCSGNPGRGGWAALLTVPNRPNARKAISGMVSSTTNNRMELVAAIEGLKALTRESQVEILSDSQYLVNTMNKGWKRNANKDLWEEIDRLSSQHQITWTWMRRNSTPELEECDRMAKEQSRTQCLN